MSSNDEVFLNQREAQAHILQVEDPTVRLLLRTFYGRAATFLMTDPEFANRRLAPIDELVLVRAAASFLSQLDLLKAILSGEITTFEETCWYSPPAAISKK